MWFRHVWRSSGEVLVSRIEYVEDIPIVRGIGLQRNTISIGSLIR
jgi:hypothetical protein